MLLPLKSDTPRGSIFAALNGELISFLQRAENSAAFDQALFSERVGAAIWDNQPTREKFHALWLELVKLNPAQKAQVLAGFTQCQNISSYYSDTTRSPVVLDDDLEKVTGTLTAHLFTNTSKLRPIETCCGETLTEFFQSFCDKNKNVCCVCGTDILAQYRADVEEVDQWRGPFDHILSQKKYPVLAIHPDNLLPTCTTCNDKAKLAKDVLRNAEGQRRISFNPYTESAHLFVGVRLEEQDQTTLVVRSFFQTEAPTPIEKLTTWDDIYRIKERVNGWFLSFVATVDTDCRSKDLASFKTNITEIADTFSDNARLAPWNFWKHLLYEHLRADTPRNIELLWAAIVARRDDPNCALEFGI